MRSQGPRRGVEQAQWFVLLPPTPKERLCMVWGAWCSPSRAASCQQAMIWVDNKTTGQCWILLTCMIQHR